MKFAHLATAKASGGAASAAAHVLAARTANTTNRELRILLPIFFDLPPTWREQSPVDAVIVARITTGSRSGPGPFA